MSGDVIVTSAAHPLRADRTVVKMPEGLTIRQMLDIVQPDPILAQHAVAFIGGHIIPRHNWHRVRPGAGAHIEIRVLPMGGGGGKNPLRILLMIAVVAASFWLGPAVGGFIFGEAGLLGISAATLGQALVGAVGMLLVNVLAPVRPPSLSGKGDKAVPTIEGARNQARPFQPVPVVLGRVRMAPAYGSSPYTEIIGGKHYIRLLFVWGIGPLAIDTSSLRIGETPITDFEGIEIEHREGYPTDAPLTLYSDTVLQEEMSVVLTQTGGWVTRTTVPQCDEIGFDITFPYGLIKHNSDGSQSKRTVIIEVNYREVGSVTWLTPTYSAMTVDSGWVSGAAITFTYKKPSSVRDGFRFPVSPRGTYEIRIRRTSADNTDNTKIADQSMWSALRTITNEDPIQSAVPVAKTAMRILATDQLNHVVDEFNGIVTSKGLDWSGTAWIEDQPIRNPASLYRHVLQGKGIAAPLPDSRIDLDTLQDFHEFCAAKGFKFNQSRDFVASVWDTLADVAAAARAAPMQIDGKWSVVIERGQAVPVSHIAPRNSSGFSAEKFFPDVPHAWRVRFPNENEDFRSDEYRVYRDGYSRANATKFESIEFPGVTDPNQIYKLGRHRIAQGVLMPERWTFSQDMEFLTYRRGDRVLLTHDVLLVGIKAGRIKTITADTNNNVTEIGLDEIVPMQAGKNYGISIRSVANPQITGQVVTVDGDHNTLTFVTPVPAVLGQPAISVGDLFGFGELGQETDDATIISVSPEQDLKARVVAVPYRPAIFAVDTEEIPAFSTNLTPMPAIPAPTVNNIVSDETALAQGIGESLYTRIAIDFAPVNDPRFAQPGIVIHGRPSETGEPYRVMEMEQVSAHRVFLRGINDGEMWDIRIRYTMAGLLLPGPWTYIYNHFVVGKGTPPGALVNMTISAIGGNAYIRWDQPDELDVQVGGKIQFRHSPDFVGASWATSTSIGTAAMANSLFAVLPLKPGTYLARVIDAGGTPSNGIATVTTKQATVIAFANLATINEAPSFSGTHSGTVASGAALLLASDGIFDDIPVLDDISSLDFYGAMLLTGTYDFAAGIDLGSVKRVRLTTRVTMVSYAVDDYIDNRTSDIDTWEDIDGSLQAAGDVVVQVRHTDGNPSATSPTWSAWERLDSAEFQARGFDFRAILTTNDPAYNVSVSVLGIDAEEITP